MEPTAAFPVKIHSSKKFLLAGNPSFSMDSEAKKEDPHGRSIFHPGKSPRWKTSWNGWQRSCGRGCDVCGHHSQTPIPFLSLTRRSNHDILRKKASPFESANSRFLQTAFIKTFGARCGEMEGGGVDAHLIRPANSAVQCRRAHQLHQQYRQARVSSCLP